MPKKRIEQTYLLSNITFNFIIIDLCILRTSAIIPLFSDTVSVESIFGLSTVMHETLLSLSKAYFAISSFKIFFLHTDRPIDRQTKGLTYLKKLRRRSLKSKFGWVQVHKCEGRLCQHSLGMLKIQLICEQEFADFNSFAFSQEKENCSAKIIRWTRAYAKYWND